MNYLDLITKLDIIDKSGQRVPFVPNSFQAKFITEMDQRNVILKARQIGFSSLILAILTWDFLLKENSRAVCISQDAGSAQKLLDRVKFFIESVRSKDVVVNLKYNSRNELVNSDKNSSLYIGQAGSKAFGRGDTLTSLHLSEFAFYDDPERLLIGVLQAVVPEGKVFIESTANGMSNYFKTFWDKSKAKQNNFKPHFFDNTFYTTEFLNEKKMDIGDESFKQEYPSNDLEAFLSSGDLFFDKDSLEWYLSQIEEPVQTYQGHYDLVI